MSLGDISNDEPQKPRKPSRPSKSARIEPGLPRSALVIWTIVLTFVALFAWAWMFDLEEVSTGTGKVVPSSREQTIQSLDGGILTSLSVKEGDMVEQGQVLALLDPTRVESNVGETASRLRAAQATAARLRAEVNGTAINFPQGVLAEPDLVRAETALYRSRRANLKESVEGLAQAYQLVTQEIAMTEPLVEKGAASAAEVLRLKREATDLKNRLTDVKNQYFVQAREELAQANAEIEAQSQVAKGKSDSLQRLTFTSPVRGVVKEIDVTTVGGVIPQNGKLMTIVPTDEQLLIEARISPRDIAFIHPDQEALVKITAYDYSIYGGLKGKVTTISPDTIRDEVKQDQFYYRVYIRTNDSYLQNDNGERFEIVPGMIATVDISTGQKTILEYLLKPFNKAKEALRER